MPPPFNLCLDMSTRKEVVVVIHIGIEVNTSIAGGRGDRNVSEAVRLHERLNQMFESIGENLDQAAAQNLRLKRNVCHSVRILDSVCHLTFELK